MLPCWGSGEIELVIRLIGHLSETMLLGISGMNISGWMKYLNLRTADELEIDTDQNQCVFSFHQECKGHNELGANSTDSL